MWGIKAEEKFTCSRQEIGYLPVRALGLLTLLLAASAGSFSPTSSEAARVLPALLVTLALAVDFAEVLPEP